MIDFDSLLKEINDFGAYQKTRFFLICLLSSLPALVTYAHSFLAPKLTDDFRCKHPFFEKDSFLIIHNITDSNITHIGECSYAINNEEIECQDWVFDKRYFKFTLTEQLSLVCSDSEMIGTAQTVYFAGYLIGSFIMGVMSDRFGRRPILLLSLILLIIGNAGVAFGPEDDFNRTTSFIIYTIGRLISSFGTSGLKITGFVLVVELMAHNKRTLAAMSYQYFFGLGQLILLSLVALNYLVLEQSWRVLAIFLLVIIFPFLSYFFVLPESVRWLLSKNKKDKAYEILQKIAKTNQSELKEESWKNYMLHHVKIMKNHQKETLIDAIKSPKIASMSLILFVIWFITNFIFYGVGQQSSDIGHNPYLSFSMAALVEILAYISIHLILDRFGRKAPFIFFMFCSGVACICISFTHSVTGVIVLALIGKYFASASNAIISLYTSELFPTSIRNSAMGTFSMVARIGATMTPTINDLSSISESLPFMIFGISGIFGSIMSLVLPETLGRDLAEDIEEANNLNKLGFSCSTRANSEDENTLKTRFSFNFKKSSNKVSVIEIN